MCQFGGEFIDVNVIIYWLVQGDFSVDIEFKCGDYVSVMQGVKVMWDSMVSIVQQVCDGLEFVVNVSFEIVLGNQDLSVCIESQVSVLQQMVVLMDELGVMVCNNVDNVQQVNQFVQSVLYIVVEGGQVVKQVVDMM